MYRGLSIAVIVPCLNEAESIAEVISYVPEFVDEIIIVDNASEDNTAEIAESHGATVIRHKKNKGYGASLRAGFNHAHSDILISGDGDNTYPIDQTRRLIDKLINNDIDFISCRRFPLMTKSNMKLTNRIGNFLFTALINILYGFKIKDALTGMWIFRKTILKSLNLQRNDWCFSAEIKMSAFANPDIKSEEQPIIYETRLGKSKLMPFSDGYTIMKYIIKSKIRRQISGAEKEERPPINRSV